MANGLQLLYKKAKNLPTLPGVYIMRDEGKNIIYIGKAKILRNRVSSYFSAAQKHSAKIERMIELVDDFDFIVTNSEFEALILECSLIKQNKPKYNTMLRDDKGYSFIEIQQSKVSWNKILAVKNKKEDENLYIGPFISGAAVSSLVESVNLAFKLPTCKKQLLKTKYSRPCLNYYIERCCAPCARKISEAEYEERLKNAQKTIKNGKKQIIAEMSKDMAIAAEQLNFEKAATLRDTIKLLEKMKDEQHVVLNAKINCDAFAFFTQKEKTYTSMIKFESGKLTQSRNMVINGELDEQTVSHVLVQYYSFKHLPTDYVVLNKTFEDLPLVLKFLTEKNPQFKGIVTIEDKKLYTQDKEKKLSATKNWQAIYNLALQNAKQGALKKSVNAVSVTQKLQNLLKLSHEPKLIEIFDISNFSDSVIVGSMVTFRDGEPDKSKYRKFKIKSLSYQNDYGSMREVLFRRFKNNIEQKRGFEQTPDLILIDGGKQHLKVTEEILLKFNLATDAAALVKDKNHKTKAIVFKGKEIHVEDNELFNFITRMQDEAHRFAITYARNLHKRYSFEQ